ncbi:hypothetical protein QQY66_50040 [Streptomyces sp. DG2A-72]|uniref:DUF6059 family protein n=1 Tax=Streptomyces sp. DG2A-72 TaxID=3051386 RepID=UPI00265C6107|nr:DUF6059 family protein [Streptomyces sp. DG2A-72]MDO0939447.1 hypothetical protein [Streptomyces sp. DG2A-72]
MKRLLRRGRQAMADHCLRPLWRSLVTFGAIHAGPEAYHAAGGPSSASCTQDPFAHARQGPPPAHPERLRADLPLSETERQLARELWPAYHAGRRVFDGS